MLSFGLPWELVVDQARPTVRVAQEASVYPEFHAADTEQVVACWWTGYYTIHLRPNTEALTAHMQAPCVEPSSRACSFWVMASPLSLRVEGCRPPQDHT